MANVSGRHGLARRGVARPDGARRGSVRQGKAGTKKCVSKQIINLWFKERINNKMATATQKLEVAIPAPNFQTAAFLIRGIAPYVQNKFSQKAREQMREKQEKGSTGNKEKGKKEAKNFQEAYELATHRATDGWCGIPAPAVRAAMISACRTVGFKMTLAKLSVFVEADGFDADDQTPLIKIEKGEPEYFESLVRLATGVADIRPRPMWQPGWEATVRIRFDADQFTLTDVTNLMMRVGLQVGIGEGRPDSKMSTGMGWGMFEVVGKE